MVQRSKFLYKTIGILLLAFLFFLAPSCSPPQPSTPTSPPLSAQTVDLYLKALSSGDYDTAYYLQSEKVRSQISLEDFRDLNRLSYEAYHIKSQSWKILSVEEGTETATVHFSLTSNFQDGTSLTKEGKYSLVKENGEWRIEFVYPAEAQSP